MAVLRKGEITFYNLDGDEIQKEPVDDRMGCRGCGERQDYEHFMIKEIHEQPKAVKDTAEFRDQRTVQIDLSDVGLTR